MYWQWQQTILHTTCILVTCFKHFTRTTGLGPEIPVIYKIYGGGKYLDRLDELIRGRETAKMALREKDGGILMDGQKKRK